jgi:hypothetical protein
VVTKADVALSHINKILRHRTQDQRVECKRALPHSSGTECARIKNTEDLAGDQRRPSRKGHADPYRDGLYVELMAHPGGLLRTGRPTDQQRAG